MTTLVSNSPEMSVETQPLGFFELVLPPSFGLPQTGIFDALGRKDSRKNLTIGEVRIDATRGPWVEVVLEVVG